MTSNAASPNHFMPTTSTGESCVIPATVLPTVISSSRAIYLRPFAVSAAIHKMTTAPTEAGFSSSDKDFFRVCYNDNTTSANRSVPAHSKGPATYNLNAATALRSSTPPTIITANDYIRSGGILQNRLISLCNCTDYIASKARR